MRVQTRIGQYCVLWRAYAELLGPVLLRGKRMPDDVIPISSAAAQPRCSSADTRERTASKNAQHACSSVSSRSNASPDMSC